MKIIDYKITVANDEYDLMASVSRYLFEGWTLQGAASPVSHEGIFRLYQTLVKYEY